MLVVAWIYTSSLSATITFIVVEFVQYKNYKLY